MQSTLHSLPSSDPYTPPLLLTRSSPFFPFTIIPLLSLSHSHSFSSLCFRFHNSPSPPFFLSPSFSSFLPPSPFFPSPPAFTPSPTSIFHLETVFISSTPPSYPVTSVPSRIPPPSSDHPAPHSASLISPPPISPSTLVATPLLPSIRFHPPVYSSPFPPLSLLVKLPTPLSLSSTPTTLHPSLP